MLEGIDKRTKMVMYVDQVGDLKGGTLISISIHGDGFLQCSKCVNTVFCKIVCSYK